MTNSLNAKKYSLATPVAKVRFNSLNSNLDTDHVPSPHLPQGPRVVHSTVTAAFPAPRRQEQPREPCVVEWVSSGQQRGQWGDRSDQIRRQETFQSPAQCAGVPK